MNFSDVIQSLNQASAFELYRMRAAINTTLEDPQRLRAIQARLQVGKECTYFDMHANALKPCKILEVRKKHVVVLDLQDRKSWIVAYAAINVDSVDVRIQEHKSKGLGRNEISVGEVVGFLDRDQQQRTGKVIRLNDKTATLLCGNVQWRVGYGYLHRVVDAGMVDPKIMDIDGTTLILE